MTMHFAPMPVLQQPPVLPQGPRPAAPRPVGAAAVLRDAPPPPPHVAHPLTAMNALLAAGSILHTADVSPWWTVAATGVAALVAPIVTSQRLTRPAKEAWFATVSSIAAGSWLTWVADTTPWSTPSLSALVIGGVGLGPLYGLLRWRRDARNRKEVEARAVRRDLAKRKVWEQILAKAGAKGVLVEDDETFRAGIKLTLALGPDSPDARSLATMTPAIERIAAGVTRLPIRNGSIQIQAGEFANRAYMIVPTRDVLAEVIDLPEMDGPRSINNPVVTGQYIDGNEVEVTLRGQHGMFAGMTNFGKSVLLDTHLAQTTLCPDAVNFLLAGNKAVRWMRPWLLPWLRGHADRPPVDWVASTVDEALDLLTDIYRAIDGRQAMPGNGVNGWEPSVEAPQINIFVDESTDLLGSTKTVVNHRGERMTFGDLLLAIVRTARSEAIHVFFCSQRGTATLLGNSGGDLKSQVLYRVGFRAKGNMTDVNAVFSTSTSGMDLANLPKGAWYVELDGMDQPKLAKGYWTSPERVSQTAIKAAAFAGGLDTPTAALMKNYPGRWTRPRQITFLEQVNGGPLRPELMDALIAQDPTVGAILAQAEAGDPGAQQLVDFARGMAEHQEQHKQGGDGYGYDSSDLLGRIEGWANEQAGNHEVAALEALWSAPEVNDADRNTGPVVLPADTRDLLAVLHASGVLYSGEKWLPSADLRALATEHLDWPDNSEGDRRITAALSEVNVESRRVGQKKVTAYPVEDLRAAVDRLNGK